MVIFAAHTALFRHAMRSSPLVVRTLLSFSLSSRERGEGGGKREEYRKGEIIRFPLAPHHFVRGKREKERGRERERISMAAGSLSLRGIVDISKREMRGVSKSVAKSTCFFSFS